MGTFTYTKDNLRKLQLVDIEMLQELDRICRANNINYIVDAGTLLGAVRHGGFIPWDDDVDVRMLRNEYNRFCEICRTELDDKYFLQTYETDKNYRWGYARILKKGTVFERKNQEMLKSKKAIFIDIFPNDNLPNNVFECKLCTCIAWLCRKTLYSEVGRAHAKSKLNRFGFMLLDIFPKKWAHLGLEFLEKRYKDISADKVRCFAWGSKKDTLGFKKEWFEETCDIEFENILVKAPVKTHEFLVHSFGEDYMTPPPIEKQKPIHVATHISF